MKEADLAKQVITWLEKKGWEVYQEVECIGGTADIIAVKKRMVWIIETKTSLSFALLDQARNRTHCAHLVSVACPDTYRKSWTAQFVMQHFGIGLVTVDKKFKNCIREQLKPRPIEDARSQSYAKKLLKELEPEHKTYAVAGSASGKRWTPFKRTCKRALKLVKSRGPQTMRQLIDGIDHHYSSDAAARSTLRDRIEVGVVPGLRLDRSTRPLQVTLSRKNDAQTKLL